MPKNTKRFEVTQMHEKIYYVELLITATRDNGKRKKIHDDFRRLRHLFNKNPDYVKILDAPHIPRGELMMILNEDAFKEIDRDVVDFLKLLSSKHMVHRIDECFVEYERSYKSDIILQ